MVFIFFSTVSCETDPCKDVDCGDYGSCDEGICDCFDGYMKDDAGLCNVQWASQYVGKYTVTDECSLSGTATYEVEISTEGTGSIKDLVIKNAWNAFEYPALATLTAENKFKIVRQNPDGDNFYIEAGGTLSADKKSITVWFRVWDEKDPANITMDECTSVWTKK